jgi:hypothetical protein
MNAGSWSELGSTTELGVHSEPEWVPLQDKGCHIEPVIDLVEIGQYAEATRRQMLCLTLWLAMSIRSSRQDDVAMVQAAGPLTWTPVRLSVSNVEFNESCLVAEVQMHGAFKATKKDSLIRIERGGSLIGIVNQGRFRLLEAEFQAREISTEYLCDSISTWIAHVEKHESKRGFGSHQFWHRLRVATDSDGIIGCCPLVAPSSFMYSLWDGITTDWGSQLQPSRPIYNLLWSTQEEQLFLSNWLRSDQVWFAVTRRTTLAPNTMRVLERNGCVVNVDKRESLVAASKSSFRSGLLRVIQSKEDWVLWASNAALCHF